MMRSEPVTFGLFKVTYFHSVKAQIGVKQLETWQVFALQKLLIFHTGLS